MIIVGKEWSGLQLKNTKPLNRRIYICYNCFKPVISISKSAIINPIVLLAKSPFYIYISLKKF